MRRFNQLAAVVTLLISAALCCAGGGGGGTVVPPVDGGDDDNTLVGTLTRERDDVEFGTSAGSLQPLAAGQSATFRSGDFVRVANGGEGLLDFGSQLVLRLFNNTDLNLVSITADAGSPLEVQMFLEDGGFTGSYSADGGSLVVDTPGGTAVVVLGTEFFVNYEPGSQSTVAGSFNGSVNVDWGSGSMAITPGHYLEIAPGGPTGPEQPIPLTRDAFEGEVRQVGSTLRVAELIMQGAYDKPVEVTEPPPPELGDTPVTCFIAFFLDTYPYYDVLVRQALGYAIDREALVEDLNPNLWQPAYSMVPPGVWSDGGYYAASPQPYDPERARELMDEGGYTGVDLSLTYYEGYADQASFVAASWEEVLGSSVELVSVPDFQMYQGILEEGPPPAFLICWAADENTPYNFLVDAPSTFYDSSLLDQVISLSADAAGSEGDAQIELYHAADVVLLLEDALVIPLYHTFTIE